MTLIKGPPMYTVCRSERKALQYAQRKAKELDHIMAVEQIGPRRWKVTDCGPIKAPAKEQPS